MYMYVSSYISDSCTTIQFSQAAKKEIAMIKVVAPQITQRVVDRAMQVCFI